MATKPDAAHERELDAATLDEYRHTIEEAAAQLDASGEHAVGASVASATAALFAALARRDQERRELRSIVQATAMMQPVPVLGMPGTNVCAGCEQVFTNDGHGWFTPDSRHTPHCPIARARALLERGQA
jgi:hypothetical protein